jgi:hypothetical protein
MNQLQQMEGIEEAIAILKSKRQDAAMTGNSAIWKVLSRAGDHLNAVMAELLRADESVCLECTKQYVAVCGWCNNLVKDHTDSVLVEHMGKLAKSVS